VKNLFFILFFLYSGFAFSQEHSFLTPIGAYEGIAGNTGIARDGSVGSVIYNPAGLSSIKSTKLSASGSAFAQNQITDTYQGEEDKVKYFQSTPAQITTVFTQNNFNWAFSVLVPKSSKYDRKQITGDVTYNEFVEDQETLFGPSIGYAINDKFKIGLSIFASKRDYKYISDVLYEEAGNYLVQTQKQSISAVTAYPLLGILLTPNDTFSLGLRFSGPSTKVSGSFEHNQKTVDQTTLGLPNGEDSKESDANYEKPMEAGLGIALNVTDNLKVLADVSNQFKKDYVVVDEDVFGNEFSFSYKSSQRYHLAFEYLTSKTDALTLGFNYNQDPLEGQDLNFIGGTIGYRSLDDIADSSFGLFFNQASYEDSDGYKTNHQIVGLFISTSINFIN
jgi:long-subunit fatty acid transport protein